MYILEDLIIPNQQKLKDITKFLKINQQQLARGEIDRSLISYIENGKTKITKETAKIIANNLKKIIQEKNLPYDIDASYILACEKEQAAYKLESHIKKLKMFFEDSDWSSFEEELANTEKVINHWDVWDKKAQIYDLAGDYYYKRDSYDKSKMYYMKSLENYVKTSNNKSIAVGNFKVARCAYQKGNYEEALNLNNYCLSILRSNNLKDDIIEDKILFNNSLFYIRLTEYSQALELITKFLDKNKNRNPADNLDARLLKGLALAAQGEKDKALDEYDKVVSIGIKSNRLDILSRAYQNIAAVYSREGNSEIAIEFLKKSIEVREKINCKNIVNTIHVLAYRYIDCKNYKLALETLDVALQKAKKHNSIADEISIYSTIVDVYVESDNDSITHANQLLEFIKEYKEKHKDKSKDKNKYKDKIEEVIIKLCKYFIDREPEKVKEILSSYA